VNFLVMRILSIDTTVIAGSVALSEDCELVAEIGQEDSGTHSEKLLVSIDQALAEAGWDRTDLEAIAVAIGPGSFTGLRIGLAAAKGLAVALGIPIAGASSLASLALNGRGFDGVVAPLIDARRGEIYLGAWGVGADGRMEGLMDECVLPPPDAVEKLAALQRKILLVGDGAAAYEGELKAGLGERAVFALGDEARPHAINLAKLALGRLGGGGDDPASISPNYIRRSDAEIGFKGKQ